MDTDREDKLENDAKNNRISYRAIIIATLALLLFWFCWFMASHRYREWLLNTERTAVSARLAPYRNSLLTSLSRRLALLDGLKALAEMEKDQKSIDRNFIPYAQNIVHDTTGIRALELMPQGVIKYVYPVAGNEAALNHNIFQDTRPEVINDIARTKKANVVVISGPLELRQGGSGLVVREALFSDEVFWGFATVILDVNEILRDAGLLADISDINYVLYRKDDRRIISGDAMVLNSHPIIHSIPLVDGSWSLAGIPAAGWDAPVAFQLHLFQFAGGLIGLLLSILVYFFFNRQYTLEKAVQQRTEELALLTEALQDDVIKQEKIEVELIQLNSSMQAISDVNQAIAHARDEITLMQEVCRILIEVRGHSLAWIGLAENDTHHTVRPVAQSGYDDGYLDSIEITWGNDEHGLGPTGSAIRTGLPVISHEIVNDPLYGPWRNEAVKRGYLSSIALPLLDRGHVFGALNIYSATEAFDEEEILELQDLAADLSFGVRALRVREGQLKVEAALRESEHRYRSLFMDNHAAILLINPTTGQIVDANNSASEFYGYSIEQLKVLYLWQISTSSPEEILDRLVVASVQRIPHLVAEHRLASGELRQVETYNGPFTINGSVLIYSLVHDISDLRRTEVALAEEKERLAVTLRSIGDGVIATDAEGKITLLNDVACALTGWTATEALGKSLPEVFNIIDENTRTPSINPVTRVLAAGDIIEIESHTVLISRDKHEYHIADSGAPIISATGSIIGVVLVFRDVTEKFEIAEKLSRQQEEYKTIVNSVPALIFFKDLQNHELSVNRAYCEMMGLPLECNGMIDVSSRFPQEDADQYFQDDLEVARSGIPLRNRIERFVTPTGTRWISTDKVPYRDKDGNIIGVIGFAIDVTDEKLAREQLEAAKEMAENANNAKNQFMAMMSHEIRTPINGIMGITEILLDEAVNTEQKEFLSMIKESSQSLMEILNDILDNSKIIAGKLELDEQPFSMRACLGAVLRTMGFRANQKGLELIGYITPQVPDFLVGDANRLRQILVNIVSNAIKFTDVGEITIRVEIEEIIAYRSKINFTVTDTGKGIPEDKIATIFEEFSQVDKSSSRHVEGTGLGLSIVERLVKLMNGQIWVESKVNQGSIFHFTVEFPHQPLESQQMIPSVQNLLGGLSAFVVDSGTANRDYLTDVLHDWGMTITQAASGKRALHEMKSLAETGVTVAVFIIDINIHDVQIADLIAQLQNANRGMGTFILMINSADKSSNYVVNNEIGIVAFLRKPIIQAELLDAIMQGIQKKGTGIVAEPLPARPARVLPSLKVLLAEDNALNQLVGRKMLEKMGHKVMMANDGVEAIRMWREMKPELIMMDILMPNIDGLEATRIIRSEESGTEKHVPIIAITANAMKGDNERCLAAGMDGYVPKPVNLERLRTEIMRVCGACPGFDQAIASEENQIFNYEEALSHMENDVELFQEMIKLFIGGLPVQLAELHQHIAKGNPVDARRLAHSLKGSAHHFYAVDAIKAASDLEDHLRSGRFEDIGVLLQNVDESFVALLKALKSSSSEGNT